ncbi:unnamed protein product [Rotaria sp. Silwood1]|nr:unnamed protein product [Rotaria sp. Silwood1]CAF3345452.1 unnamed protein product [Rotaria sp. Silwood1]CAF3349674.1 unnamed protein product [Rotaria sp. Silwood1]CAF4520044.1 unnamed protein product [Rotaria sp. Silwood1]CAF4564106.1 unnamed protein product [Rotaria sp. Silwood1]
MNNYNHSALNNNSYIGINNSTMIENNLFLIIFSAFLVIVMFIGVIGNLLVIYVVLNYGRLKTVTNTYLLHLALSDFIFLSGIPFFASSLIIRAWIFGGFICKLFFVTQGINQYTSVIILALLAFDRYLAVCHSAKSIIWRSRVNPNLLLILTWILSFILMLPIMIFTTIETSNASKAQCSIIFPYSDPRFLYFIFFIYTSTITFGLPFGLMIYFYIQIVRRLKHKVSQQHRRSRTSTRTRRKVSILVLAVISVHILCCSPYWTFQIITISELLPQTSSLLVPISSITQFLLFVNSSTNPILYAFLSGIFRLSFKHVFYCCLSTNDDQYLHAKTVIKKNLTLSSNKNNLNQTKKQKIPMKTVTVKDDTCQTVSKKQSLTISTNQININLINEQKRNLLVEHNASVLSFDASFVSDL